MAWAVVKILLKHKLGLLGAEAHVIWRTFVSHPS